MRYNKNSAPPVASAGISHGAFINTPNVSINALPNGYFEYHLPFRMLMCGDEENPCSGGAGTESFPSANNFA